MMSHHDHLPNGPQISGPQLHPGTDDLAESTLSTMAFSICTIQALSSLLGSFEVVLRSGGQCKGEDLKS